MWLRSHGHAAVMHFGVGLSHLAARGGATHHARICHVSAKLAYVHEALAKVGQHLAEGARAMVFCSCAASVDEVTDSLRKSGHAAVSFPNEGAAAANAEAAVSLRCEERE